MSLVLFLYRLWKFIKCLWRIWKLYADSCYLKESYVLVVRIYKVFIKGRQMNLPFYHLDHTPCTGLFLYPINTVLGLSLYRSMQCWVYLYRSMQCWVFPCTDQCSTGEGTIICAGMLAWMCVSMFQGTCTWVLLLVLVLIGLLARCVVDSTFVQHWLPGVEGHTYEICFSDILWN